MFKLTINKTIESDNYFNGCNPDSFQDFGNIESIKFKSLDDLITYMQRNYKSDDLAIFDDHIIYQCNENDNGDLVKLSDSIPDGWLACYHLYIEKIETESIGNDQLKTIFPNLSEV